jgi:hypothetical protein
VTLTPPAAESGGRPTRRFLRPGGRTALALTLASLALYNVNLREISSSDTFPARVLPHEVIRYGRLDLDRLFRFWPAGAPLPYWVQRVGPHYRSSYPVAPALLAVPVYAAPVLLGAGNDWVVLNVLSKVTASLLVALSVALVYLAARELARRLGTGEGSAVATAVVYAVATPTWAVSSQGLWGHAPAQLGLALALWGLLRAETVPWVATVAGLGAGLMVASRPSTAPVAAVLAVFALVRLGWRGLGFTAALGAVGGVVAAHNLVTFGTLQGGYAELHRMHAEHHGVASAWSASFVGGLAGVLLSPSRGLFVYSPVLLFPAAGLVLWLARRRGEFLAGAAAVAGVGIATIAMFSVWWGGHSFGPRLVGDVAPALVLGLVPVWPVVWRSRGWRGLFLAAFAASAAVGAVGAFHYPSARSVDWNTAPRNVDHAHERLWDWRDPQLLRLLRNGRVPAGFLAAP